MKKSELLKRIEALESGQKAIKEDVQKLDDDVFYRGSITYWWGAVPKRLHTKTKIEKILEYLGIEIYETSSEIKVRSTKLKKKKGKNKAKKKRANG